MKVYVDTNVLIDFVCRRVGFADAACIVTRNKKDFAHSSRCRNIIITPL